VRGEVHEQPAPGFSYQPASRLATLEALVLPAATRRIAEALPALLAADEVRAVVVCGPRRNGRRTMLGALARALGRGVLELAGPAGGTDLEEWRQHWSLLGPLATALHALPVVVFDLAPGETGEIPVHRCYHGPTGVVLGRQGGIDGPGAERAVAISLDPPTADARHTHWSRGLGQRLSRELDEIATRYRLTSGNIHRVARLAPTFATLSGRPEVTLADVQQAGAMLNRQALDTLATRVPPAGDWSLLAVRPETHQGLRDLVTRCRCRERLPEALGVAFGTGGNAGVRALFTGPSGTGKTLAARLLAADLQQDLYRLDIAAVVDKYIGETEKNLSQLLGRVEELDVILLLDEGDALLGRRSDVHSATDRYANLETNYLLQRLESFDGILIVTTNAGDRIDGAFERRMDVVVNFYPPDAEERLTIWELHLPIDHAIEPRLLHEVVVACALSGGQIRNAALHAALLALEAGGRVTSDHLRCAIQREYRKAGRVSPLRAARNGG
jgi:hypothetical protein